MKKLLFAVLLVAGLFAMPMTSYAADGVDVFEIALTTDAVTGNDVAASEARMPFDGGGTKRMSRLEVTITSTNTAQTVNFYDTATSSDVISGTFSYVVGADAAGAASTTSTKSWDFISPTSGSNLTYYKVTDFYAKKSATSGVVTLRYWYLK